MYKRGARALGCYIHQSLSEVLFIRSLFHNTLATKGKLMINNITFEEVSYLYLHERPCIIQVSLPPLLSSLHVCKSCGVLESYLVWSGNPEECLLQ